MCLNPYDYQSKANRYRKGLTYLKNRVTASQEHTIDSQKPKRREQGHNKKKIIKPQKEEQKEKERSKEEIQFKVEKRFKMVIHTYVSIKLPYMIMG